MKKLIFTAACLIMSVAAINAQEENVIMTSADVNPNKVFAKNDVVLNASIGIGTAVNIGRTIVPPIALHGEYCVVDNLFDANSSIGVGVYLGFAAGRADYYFYGGAFTQKVNSVLIGVRGAFHYQFVDKLDTYAGITLGGNIANVRGNGMWYGVGMPKQYGGFLGDFFVGARYYVQPKFAVFGELGFGVAYLNIGVSLKI